MGVTLATPEKILPQKELIALRPKDRDAYISDFILKILKLNPRGVTISQVAKETKLTRITVSKHLEMLVAVGEAYKVTRGNLAIYYKNGKVVHATDVKISPMGDRFYTFYRLENEEGGFIYIQEKSLDAFNATKVSGGIIIRDKDFMPFLKELQAFALGVG